MYLFIFCWRLLSTFPFLCTADMCQLLECVGHSDDFLPMLVFCGQRILVFLWNLRVSSCRFKKFSFSFKCLLCCHFKAMIESCKIFSVKECHFDKHLSDFIVSWFGGCFLPYKYHCALFLYSPPPLNSYSCMTIFGKVGPFFNM